MEKLDLEVIDLQNFDVLLGIPWLRRMNPTIDWPTSTIEFNFEDRRITIYARENQVAGPYRYLFMVDKDEVLERSVFITHNLKRYLFIFILF